MTTFRNQDGTITSYAFACGYVEKYGNDTPRATISREANGYHVKGFDKDGKHFWEIVSKVKDARAFARKQAGKLVR
jgi:TPP-dependent pyruvate/acetoin dehydrogenase alpha subunit